jgi:epoxide hydrolase-like predicted phosphatase
MSEIKAVFFDFGGVLLKHADGVDHKALEALHELPERTLLECVYIESRYRELQVGGATHEEWAESAVLALAARVGQVKAEEIWSAFEQAERPLNADMLDLVRRLRKAGYKVGIISNTTPGMVARLKERYPEFPAMFDDIIGSGDVELAKPDRGIFDLAVKQMGVALEDSVFADDVRKYAEAATEIGMKGFHFTGYEGFVEDLASVGVSV